MQEAIAKMDPLDLIIQSVPVKGAFCNIPHQLSKAIWREMGLPFEGVLHA